MFPEPGIPTRCAVFLPHSNNMHVRLTGNSKLACMFALTRINQIKKEEGVKVY